MAGDEAKTLRQKIAALFQKIHALFSAAGIGSMLDTLKLMVRQMGEPSCRLIGFLSGVFILSPAHSVRAAVSTGCAPSTAWTIPPYVRVKTSQTTP